MDLGQRDGFGLGRRNEGDHLSFHESGIPSDWRFGNAQACLFTPNTSIAVCQGDQTQMGSSSSSTSMAAYFGGRRLWGSAISSQNSSFCDAAVQRNPVLPPPALEVGWSSSDPMVKGGAFLQNGVRILSPGLSQFSTDSAFIERAARFSCFGGAGVGCMASPFSANGSPIPFSNAQKNEVNVGEAFEDVSVSVGSPLRTQRAVASSDQEFSVRGQDETQNSDNTAGKPSSIGFSARKRKRGNQEMELDQAEGGNQISVGSPKENTGGKRKEEQNNSTPPAAKANGKNGKDSVGAPKEDYVHVRARRGQATNSHSLAERVRREKISERMKFLQDLVPGCSKVTGKAVMLDEIINYVQSLQRQVEFLSMKLAAVSPRLDINIEWLLSKEILQSRAVSSTTIGFPPDMVHPQLHPAEQALGQSGFPVIGNPSDALRRAINAQLTAMNAYREPSNQIPNAWDTDLHNVVQMDLSGNAALNIQELNGLPQSGPMKPEP